MTIRRIYQEYRQELNQVRYPFSDQATLTNGQDIIPTDLLLDAVLHPAGFGPRLYLSRIDVDFDKLTFFMGDQDNEEIASGEFQPQNPQSEIVLKDKQGRVSGLLIGEIDRWKSLQAWNLGQHLFELPQTEFCASVCWPLPDYGVRGILLDDGSLMTNEVWLVGGAGVVLKHTMEPDPFDPSKLVPVIHVIVTGDPLFRYQQTKDHFRRFLQQVTFQKGCDYFIAHPDIFGRIVLQTAEEFFPNSALRIQAGPDGLEIRVVGETIGT